VTIATTGFDAGRATPPPTTVRQPLVERGRLAAPAPPGLIQGEPPAAVLLVRAGTAAPTAVRP